MEIEWRGVTAADVPAWCRLLAAAEAVDKTAEHYDEADLTEELEDPATTYDDRLAAWRGDDMVAFAALRPRLEVQTYWRIDAEGTTHPDHRGTGLGRHGLAWTVERATRLRDSRHPGVETRVQLTGRETNPDQISLLEDAGFKAVHWSATMRVQLDAAVDAARASSEAESWPAGTHLATYDLPLSTQTQAAHNAAFLDHWGFLPWSTQMWKQWVDDTKNARHDLSWVLLADDDHDHVVGYLLTNEFTAHQAVTGRREAYLAKIGTRREARGRGIATGLLRHAIQAYAAAGFDESSLDVDTANPTGAFRLYERVGYRVEARTATYELVLDA